jgi:hypothetical protein
MHSQYFNSQQDSSMNFDSKQRSLIQAACMKNLRGIEKSVLIDMLAEYTAKYTRMLAEGSDDKEYATCRLMINALQQEIESRKQDFENNSTVSGPQPGFE